MDGKRYYEVAVALTDLYDRRFEDMMVDDFRSSLVEREYFVGEHGGLELMGWATFCRRMESEGQGEWLAKIEALDDEVLLRVLGRKLVDAESKEEADSALKGLQGLLSRRKVKDDSVAAVQASSGTTLNVYITGAAGGSESESSGRE